MFAQFIAFIQPVLAALPNMGGKFSSEPRGRQPSAAHSGETTGPVKEDNPANPIHSFFADLFEAVRRDLGTMTSSAPKGGMG